MQNVISIVLLLPFLFSGIASAQSSSISFDGIDDYVVVGDSPELSGMPELSLEAWYKKPSNTSNDGIIIAKWGADNDSTSMSYYLYELPGADSVSFVIHGSSGDASAQFPSALIAPDVWHHICATYTGHYLEIYVNGVQRAFTYKPVGPIQTTSTDLVFGARGNVYSENYAGSLDEVRIWDRVLTRDEILSHVLYGSVNVDSGLVGNWDFDEGVGDTIQDKSIHGNHGQIYGSSWDSNRSVWTPRRLEVPDNYMTIQEAIDIAINGDSILVDSGTYIENIHFWGKDSIVLLGNGPEATIIDGGGENTVVEFQSCDTALVMEGFTIRNGNMGVNCSSGSPKLVNLIIEGNHRGESSYFYGAGLMCSYSAEPILYDVTIRNNSTSQGGGIYTHEGAHPILVNVIVEGNSAKSWGGGINARSNMTIINSIIRNNMTSEDDGGGIYTDDANVSIYNSIIENNNSKDEGGGIFSRGDSTLFLSNTTIRNNIAKQGGGLALQSTKIEFDSLGLCNIYLNKAQLSGNDIYSNWTPLRLFLDTCTVITPSRHQIMSGQEMIISMNISNGLIQQVAEDLYLSSTGDDRNDGLTPSSPLKTLFMAGSKIKSNAQERRSINLSEGVYSSTTTGETYPINLPSYISLVGVDVESVILDGENKSRVLNIAGDSSIVVKNLTITNGYAQYGGGVYIAANDITLDSVLIVNNEATESAGGIFCGNSDSLRLCNVVFSNNIAKTANSLYAGNASVNILNSILWNENSSQYEVELWGITSAYSELKIEYSIIKDGEIGITNNDVHGNSVYYSSTNMNSNPIFCDTGNRNYSLVNDSPCLGNGKGGSNIGVLGIGCTTDATSTRYLPGRYELLQNYPNPFNPITKIRYDLPIPSDVTLRVYDITGRQITTLVDISHPAGTYSQDWNGTDDLGDPVSTGVYFARIHAGNYSKVIKMLYLK